MPIPLSPAESAVASGAAGWRVPRFRPRVLPTLAAIAAVVVCVAAGNWQQARMRAKEALGGQLAAATQSEPIVLASLPASADWPSLRYRPVEATGEYLPNQQILIDNKVVAGRAGFHVVTPLALADGRYVLVNRGWVAQGRTRARLPDVPPPRGTVSVRGRIATPPTGYFELQREDGAGPVRQNLDLARFAAATGISVLPAIIEATATPVPDDGLIRDWPAPDFGIETHRIYMMQWYAFALVVVFLWFWLNRPKPADDHDH